MNGAEELNDRFYTGFILMLCGVCVFFTLFVLIVIFGKKIKVKWNKVIFFGLLRFRSARRRFSPFGFLGIAWISELSEKGTIGR